MLTVRKSEESGPTHLTIVEGQTGTLHDPSNSGHGSDDGCREGRLRERLDGLNETCGPSTGSGVSGVQRKHSSALSRYLGIPMILDRYQYQSSAPQRFSDNTHI